MGYPACIGLAQLMDEMPLRGAFRCMNIVSSVYMQGSPL